MLLRLLPVVVIMAVVVYIGIANVRHAPLPSATAISVDDDPDPVSRARTQCQQFRSTPEYLHGDDSYRRATDEMCEEQIRDAERIKYGR